MMIGDQAGCSSLMCLRAVFYYLRWNEPTVVVCNDARQDHEGGEIATSANDGVKSDGWQTREGNSKWPSVRCGVGIGIGRLRGRRKRSCRRRTCRKWLERASAEESGPIRLADWSGRGAAAVSREWFYHLITWKVDVQLSC